MPCWEWKTLVTSLTLSNGHDTSVFQYHWFNRSEGWRNATALAKYWKNKDLMKIAAWPSLPTLFYFPSSQEGPGGLLVSP